MKSSASEPGLDSITRPTTSTRFFRVFSKYRLSPQKASFYHVSLEKLALLSLVKEVTRSPDRKMIKLFHLIFDIIVFATTTLARKLVVEWRWLSRFPAKIALVDVRAPLTIESSLSYLSKNLKLSLITRNENICFPWRLDNGFQGCWWHTRSCRSHLSALDISWFFERRWNVRFGHQQVSPNTLQEPSGVQLANH